MDDKVYYKLRQVQLELEYLSKLSEESDNGLIESEDKKRVCRIMLADILRYTSKIQTKMGTEFIPEF